MTVEPQKVIDVYQVSPDPKQFYYGIIKLKSPTEVRGKSKPPKIVAVTPIEQTITVVSEIIPNEKAIPEYHEPHEEVYTDEAVI